ncbi:hypothetical protein AZZ88_004393 [Escherichia coli]|nr:hypothetical protein AZZ88_004393 [Escherichia coli]
MSENVRFRTVGLQTPIRSGGLLLPVLLHMESTTLGLLFG